MATQDLKEDDPGVEDILEDVVQREVTLGVTEKSS
jgi:hypothetical protein